MSRPSARAARPAQAAPIFAALGDETRLELVTRLGRTGPLSISRLAAGSSVSRQAVTKHLNVLAEAGLVRGERRGRESIWEFRSDPLDVARRFIEQVSHQWDERLERLRQVVEE
jgi:DNA-binding transcriptional ArsR family regulator